MINRFPANSEEEWEEYRFYGLRRHKSVDMLKITKHDFIHILRSFEIAMLAIETLTFFAT